MKILEKMHEKINFYCLLEIFCFVSLGRFFTFGCYTVAREVIRVIKSSSSIDNYFLSSSFIFSRRSLNMKATGL